MNNVSDRASTCSPNFLVGFIVLALIIYDVAYRPFITWMFLPSPVRLGIEGFVLFLLLVINLRYRYYAGLMWGIVLALLFGLVLFMHLDTFEKVASTITKWMFLILAIGLFVGSKKVLYASIKLWIKLSYLLSVMSILAFVGYKSGLIPFSPMVLSGGYFFHNPILGNLIPRRLFGIEFGRVTGFMHQGQYMGFILGMNILLAKDWIQSPVRRTRFIWFNLLAGIFTLSTTFFAFFTLYFLSTCSVAGKKPDILLRITFFSALGALVVGVLLGVNYFDQTSASIRMERFFLNWSYFLHGDWLSMLLGYGTGVMRGDLGIGFESGWFAILIDRGVIMLGLMAALFAMLTRHNPWLLFYICLTHFADNLFWSPLFLMLIAMSYAYHKDTLRRVVVPARTPEVSPADGRGVGISSPAAPKTAQ